MALSGASLNEAKTHFWTGRSKFGALNGCRVSRNDYFCLVVSFQEVPGRAHASNAS